VISQAPRPIDLASERNWDDAKIISGPKTLADRDEWRAELRSWREASAKRFSYDGSAYNRPGFVDDSSYSIALIWIWDELLFDFEKQVFTPEKLIADSQKFGGFDGIILWHAYPVIGVDTRNQFDFYNDVPGLAQLITALQAAGIKIYLNYNPWGKWNKRDSARDEVALAALVKRFNFDGVFLDTMKSANPDFMVPILQVKPDIIVAGESTVQQGRICDHTMSWGQWFADSQIPGVLRAKYFEPRHMVHQTRRWNRSHIEELHIAWLNGAGMLIWEVVFGSWVGWNNRDACMWREMVAVLRQNHEVIVSGEWEPLTALSPEAEHANLFASSFELDGRRLITIINKSDKAYSGALALGLTGVVPAWGVAAISQSPTNTTLVDFTYDKESSTFPHHTNHRISSPKGSLTSLTYTYRNRETSLYSEAVFIDAWKPLPPHLHQILTAEISAPVRVGILDSLEVSNQEFYEFIQATDYTPRIANRFLAHWINGVPTPAQADSPVVYVDVDDAIAYATWKGCEIPTEWEWQFNADLITTRATSVWNLTNSIQSDGRTRFLILKGGGTHNLRNGQGSHSASGLAESDWYIDGGVQDGTWIEKLLLMGLGLSRSENIGFRCFMPSEEG